MQAATWPCMADMPQVPPNLLTEGIQSSDSLCPLLCTALATSSAKRVQSKDKRTGQDQLWPAPGLSCFCAPSSVPSECCARCAAQHHVVLLQAFIRTWMQRWRSSCTASRTQHCRCCTSMRSLPLSRQAVGAVHLTMCPCPTWQSSQVLLHVLFLQSSLLLPWQGLTDCPSPQSSLQAWWTHTCCLTDMIHHPACRTGCQPSWAWSCRASWESLRQTLTSARAGEMPSTPLLSPLGELPSSLRSRLCLPWKQLCRCLMQHGWQLPKPSN